MPLIPGNKPQRYTPEQVIDAIVRGNGMTSHAAKLLGCSIKTVENYVKRNKLIRQAFDDERTKQLDAAELALKAATLSQQPWAVTFTLSTIGKARGYTRQDEVKHSGQIEVPIREIVIERAPVAKRDRDEAESGPALDG